MSAVRVWLILLGVVCLLPLVSRPASAEANSKAADRFATCVAASGQADVLVLMDESGSLGQTDRDGERLTATRFLLGRLADLTEDGAVSIGVRLAGFGDEYRTLTEWRPLNSSTLPVLTDRITNYAADTNATDYWLGLDGARRDLAARAKERPKACRAIIFFSDGELDIQPGRGENDYHRIDRPYADGNPLQTPAQREAAKKAAAQSLCRKGGLADQIRKQGIIVFGVGLERENGTTDFDLMRRVTTGGQGCGGITKPVPGDFMTVSDINELLFAFDRAKPGSGPETTAPVCQGKVCAEGAHSFVLDGLVSRVDVLATAPVDNVQVFLTAPGGKPVQLPHTEASTPIPVAGAVGRFRWYSDKTVSIRLTAENAKKWTGQWQLAFVDPASQSGKDLSRARVEVTGDIRPLLLDSESLQQVRQGVPASLRVGVERESGERINRKQILGSLQVTADLLTADGAERRLWEGDKSNLGVAVQLTPDSYPLGAATLRLTLSATTAPTTVGSRKVPGTALTPTSRDYPLTVLAPANFPTVQGTLDFGVLDGTTQADAMLSVTGPGCAWLVAAGQTVDTAPEEAGSVTLQSPQIDQQSCVSVAGGQSANLPVSLTAESAGNGLVSGTLMVGIASADDPDQRREVPVAFTAELRKPLNQVNYWSTLIAALVLGLGIPLALLYAIKFLFNSRIPAGALHAVRCDVELTEGGSVLRDGAPLSVSSRELAKLVDIPRRGARRLVVAGHELVSRLGWSPFGSAVVDVRVPGAQVASSSRATPGDGHSRLPLSIADTWVASRTASGPAQVLLLISGATAASPDRLSSFLADARTRLPDTLSRLGVSSGQGGQPDDPWGGHASSTGGRTTDDPFSDDDPFA